MDLSHLVGTPVRYCFQGPPIGKVIGARLHEDGLQVQITIYADDVALRNLVVKHLSFKASL